jgi:O-antigen/teichoic acid export membrane protein
MLRKLFSHTAIYGLAPQISKVASVFALPLITAHLTATDYGIYGLITAVVGSISVLSYLGLNVILSNSYFKSPYQYKWVWRQIYGFLVLWNIPYAFLLAGVIYYFIPVEAAEHTWLIIFLNTLPVVFFGPTAMIATMYYQLRQKPFQIAIRSGLIGILTVGLNVYFIAFEEMGYLGWFLAGTISQMINQVSYWIPLNKHMKLTPIFNFKWRLIKKQLRVSLPTVPHYYGAYLLNASDRVIMKFLNIPTANIGLYNAANTVGNIVSMMANASGQAIGPMLLQSYKNKDELLARKLCYILQIAFFAGTFLLSIWLKEIFFLLIRNNTLNQVYPLGIIIVMAYNYRPMYFAANNRLFYYEKTKVLIKITFVAGIINVLLNFLLIPIWGYQVAAYTTFGCLMYMGYAGFFLKEFKEHCRLNYHPVKWLALTLLLTVAAYYAVHLNVILKIVFTLFIPGITYVAIKRLNASKSIKSIFKS